MSNIIYNPYIFTNRITGNTNLYVDIDLDIDIDKGCTFNIAYFDKNVITKFDIIDSVVNYIDNNTDKFFFNVLIVDDNESYEKISSTGLYCVKIYYNNIIDYFLINVINDILDYNSIILYYDYILTYNSIITTTTTTIKSPLIYYNYSPNNWIGGDLKIPSNIFLNLIHDNLTGWTANQLLSLFVNYVYDFYEQNVDINRVEIKLYQTGSSVLIDEILKIGSYDVIFLYTDMFDNSIVNSIVDINVYQEEPLIYYNSNILNDSISANTNIYTGVTNLIESNIIIDSGFTFNLYGFDNNIITKYDIITSLINYVQYDIDKFLFNVIIADENNVYEQLTTTGTFCIKFYYNNISEYLLMNIINDSSKNSIIYYNDFNLINNDITTTTTTTIKTPLIYYKYSNEEVWNGGDIIIPYDVTLHLIHDGLNGWTINNLRNLFIENIYSYYEFDVDINDVDVKIYKEGSLILEQNINNVGFYKIIFSYSDLFNNTISDVISNIRVIHNSPIIYFNDYILSKYLSGSTNDYTSITNNIEPNIIISSGFTFNLGGFDNNKITKDDIIYYLIQYVRSDIDEIIDKYSVEVIIAKGVVYNIQNIYNDVINPGIFCVKISKENIFGDKTIRYFIMKVVSNISVYSEGYWQDNKVWIDSVVWLDHNIII